MKNIRFFIWKISFFGGYIFNIFEQACIRNFEPRATVVTAFFMSTETHAKRFLTVWKRSVSTTLKRPFTVLANQIIVSETFQAFQILTNHISVRKTLSWKPCLVSNVSAFAELANQNPADSIYFTSFFFFFFFFFPISLNYNCYKINKNNSQIILWRRVSDAINRKCVLTDSDSGPVCSSVGCASDWWSGVAGSMLAGAVR